MRLILKLIPLFFFFFFKKNPLFKKFLINKMSNASAAYTGILATTAVDSYMTVGSSESFFVGSSQKYAQFQMTHVISNLETMSGNAKNITIERDGDYLAGLAVIIKGPGLKSIVTGEPGAPLCPGVGPGSRAESVARYPASDASTTGTHANAIANDSRPFDVCPRYCDFAPCHMIGSAALKIGNIEFDNLKGEHIAAYYQSFAEIVPREMLNAGGRDERSRIAARTNVQFIVPLPFSFFTAYSKTLNLLGITYNTLTLTLTMVDPTTCIENLATGVTMHNAGDADTALISGKYSAPTSAPVLADYEVGLLSTYVYVTQSEREARLNETADVLILQHQINESLFTDAASGANVTSKDLNFNFPVHALFFCPVAAERAASGEKGCYLGKESKFRMSADNINGMPAKLLSKISLNVNNQLRIENDLQHFYTDFTHQRHSLQQNQNRNHMYLYSFGLHSPYQGDPNGSLNFSRLSSVKASFTLGSFGGDYGTVSCNVLALSWNVMNLNGGSATLRFS